MHISVCTSYNSLQGTKLSHSSGYSVMLSTLFPLLRNMESTGKLV